MDDRNPVSRLAATAALLMTVAGASGASTTSSDPYAWHEVAALPSTWIEQMSFVSARVGFAAAGNGQVLRTMDGGVSWTPVIDAPYPYYWYGVHALTSNDIVAAGFFNSDVAYAAMIRWSHDGGDTWSDDLVLSHNLYVRTNHVHFWDSQVGFVATSSGSPDMFRTTSGGLALTDWTAMTIDDEWFGPQFSALPNGHVRISGGHYCESDDYAATWSCRHSIDPVSDYVTFFIDDQLGWVGGGGDQGEPVGQPPNFRGYVYRTADGGATWSARTLDVTWPIQAIIFVNKRDGWAMGGYAIAPLLPDTGGAYISHDGGLTWTMETDLGLPLQTCATADYHLFCSGIDADATSHVFERDFDHIRVAEFDGGGTP